MKLNKYNKISRKTLVAEKKKDHFGPMDASDIKLPNKVGEGARILSIDIGELGSYYPST